MSIFGYPMDSWTSAIGTRHTWVACPILWSNPIFSYFTEIAPCVLPCPKTQEHQSTCVDSWVYRVPENGHQPLGRGNSLWRAACPILWSNPIVLRYFTVPSGSLALSQEHQRTCVDYWVLGYPKMDTSHWDGLFTMAFSLPNIVIKGLRYFTDCPLCAPLPYDSGTPKYLCDSWVPRVPENGHQPLGRGNSLWRSACPILWSNPIF